MANRPLSTGITVTALNKQGVLETTEITRTKLYQGRTSEDIAKAEKWSKRVTDGIFGKVSD